jgi:hypothetical protein
VEHRPFAVRAHRLVARVQIRAAERSSVDDGKPYQRALWRIRRTPDHAFADVENVLLYNVGSGCLSHLTRNGIEERAAGRATRYLVDEHFLTRRDDFYWRSAGA